MKKIALWRSEPVVAKGKSIALEYVFPSGRQALSAAINAAGLSRGCRVAIPDWSSHCVISAVGKYAMPIPISEVLEKKITVDAVLVYEQWGWPLMPAVKDQLREKFKDAVFILDAVDSAHYFKREEKIGKDFIHLTSLSKLLGLSGGGIVLVNGKYLKFQAEIESATLLSNIKIELPETVMKQEIAALSDKLKKWLMENNLKQAIEAERVARQHNLQQILSDTWPDWMKQAVETGAGPGIVPLLRGASPKTMVRKRDDLLENYGVETCIYYFNWSGNPLKPEYEKCLAFPVHGQISNIKDILLDAR